MVVEFCRWGNSLAVRIPKAVADALKVSSGKRAEIRIENGTLVLRPILKPARKPRYTLETCAPRVCLSLPCPSGPFGHRLFRGSDHRPRIAGDKAANSSRSASLKTCQPIARKTEFPRWKANEPFITLSHTPTSFN